MAFAWVALDSTCGILYHSHHKTATDPTTQETAMIRGSIYTGFILNWLVPNQGKPPSVWQINKLQSPE